MYARTDLETGEILRVGKRPVVRLDDGSLVSDEFLAAEGVYPIVDDPPEHDEEVEVAERLPFGEWVVEDGLVYVQYEVRPLTEQELGVRAADERQRRRAQAEDLVLQEALVERAEAEVQDEGTSLERVQQLAGLFPDWEPGVWYDEGRVLYWHGTAVRVRQGHTSQAEHPPGPETTALYWIYREEGSVEPWQQPGGTIPPYMEGERATHNGRLWESNIDHNVWEPGSPGAETLWTDLGPA